MTNYGPGVIGASMYLVLILYASLIFMMDCEPEDFMHS